MKTLTLIALLVLVQFSCRKEPASKNKADSDTVVVRDIKGMVNNLCTDKGLEGITVFLEIYKGNSLIFKTSQVSDANGFFTFSGVKLHTAPEYKNCLYIPSKSGIAAKNKETCGIMGGTLNFSVADVDHLLKPNVIPSFIYLSFYFPRKQTTVASDSIIARFEQRTYHKNVPDYPYKFGAGSTGDRSGYTSHWGLGNYPMGLYHIVVDKWVGGVHTQWNDSLYTNYGDTAAYVVHW